MSNRLKHIRSILLLPVMALVVIPAVLLLLTPQLRFDPPVAAMLISLSGLFLIILGLSLITVTVRLFMQFGDGTLAPWDETQKLVVRGPYRYVRNPMHLGVFMTLFGEGLFFRTYALLIFGAVAVAGHIFYFPWSEEPGLERRFGEAYRVYKQNVPRWLPRLRPWTLPDDQ